MPGDGSLTQDEIDMLLMGADSLGPSDSGGGGGGGGSGLAMDMSPLEREAVADLMTQALQSGTQGLSMILSKGIRLGQPYAEVRQQAEMEREFGQDHVFLGQKITGALNGTLGLFIPTADAAKISALVMGSEDAVSDTLDSAHIATVKDALGPMLFAMVTQVSVRIGSAVSPMPVEVTVLDGVANFPLSEASSYLRIQIPFTVEGTVQTRASIGLPLPLATEMYRLSQAGTRRSAGAQDFSASSAMDVPAGPLPGQQSLKTVDFPSINNASPGPLQANMNLLLDVQMTLTVELGRTNMYIKDILSLGEGSIIELDKLAGEPVDLLVNNKLIAKGEVVVIDENFGVRVTDIVSTLDRLKTQKQQR